MPSTCGLRTLLVLHQLYVHVVHSNSSGARGPPGVMMRIPSSGAVPGRAADALRASPGGAAAAPPASADGAVPATAPPPAAAPGTAAAAMLLRGGARPEPVDACERGAGRLSASAHCAARGCVRDGWLGGSWL